MTKGPPLFKLVPCSYIGCQYLRELGFDNQVRTHQHVEVPEEYEGPAYCSRMCQVCDNLA